MTESEKKIVLSTRDDDYSDMVDQPDVSLISRPMAGEPYERIFQRRLARRDFMKGSAAVATSVAVGTALAPEEAKGFWGWGWGRNTFSEDSLTFTPIEGSNRDAVVLPRGYEQDVVIRWGDALDPWTPDLNTDAIPDGELLKPGAGIMQARQFGYNCDAVEFFPAVPGTPISSRGLVCCNHEYTQPEMKYPDWPLFGTEIVVDPDANETRPETAEETEARIKEFVEKNPELVKVELAAHGISVVQVGRFRRGWRYRKRSRFNRRITGETEILISGPAAGHPLLRTSDDPSGVIVKGTLNNCAGGQTPWGTYLSAEENVDQYFGNYDAFAARASSEEEMNIVDAHARLPLPGGQSNRGWEYAEKRFDVDVEPKEALRFGWVVEVDPYDPTRFARKRTALGRFKHECATTILSRDNHCVVYSGDDARMEYVFKFVSAGVYNPRAPREEAMDLLDDGTLYAARFDEDGTGVWLPLVHGEGPLTADNGFDSQAEVLIKARKAADLLGATPMDRPEDCEANPKTGKVYIALTNNTRRQNEDAGATDDFQGREVNTFPNDPNPRGPNRFGHIMEITEDGNDNAAESFRWEIFLLAGDPQTTVGSYFTDLDNLVIDPDGNTAPGQEDVYYAGFDDPSQVAPIGSPDNISFDNLGNLWIVTDGTQPRGTNNGGFAVPTEGPNRGKLRQFLSGPVDCETCGAEFTPDNRTLFINVQHPGAVFALAGLPNLKNPSSYWPDSSVDGGAMKQPRPSLIAIRNGRFGWRRVGE